MSVNVSFEHMEFVTLPIEISWAFEHLIILSMKHSRQRWNRLKFIAKHDKLQCSRTIQWFSWTRVYRNEHHFHAFIRCKCVPERENLNQNEFNWIFEMYAWIEYGWRVSTIIPKNLISLNMHDLDAVNNPLSCVWLAFGVFNFFFSTLACVCFIYAEH